MVGTSNLSVLLDGDLYFIFSVDLSGAEAERNGAIARRVAPVGAPFTVAVPESQPDTGIVARGTAGPTAIMARLPTASLGMLRVTYPVTHSFSPKGQFLFSS